MATFMIGLAILICGGFLYGSLCERVFGRITARPCVCEAGRCGLCSDADLEECVD